ncbi:DUF4528 domain-containing protein, partial [Escherichia coli]|uniref:DUF4528 domain-containing protein n=1 Tax=Escherichia coli TaxID=562 RepID=UPI00214C68E2
VLNKTGPQSIHILRGVRQQQDEPGRFSICSRQAAVVPEFIKYHCSKDEINDLSKMIERWL